MPRTGRGIKLDGLIQMGISSLESRGGGIQIIKSGGKGKLPADTDTVRICSPSVPNHRESGGFSNQFYHCFVGYMTQIVFYYALETIDLS